MSKKKRPEHIAEQPEASALSETFRSAGFRSDQAGDLEIDGLEPQSRAGNWAEVYRDDPRGAAMDYSGL